MSSYYTRLQLRQLRDHDQLLPHSIIGSPAVNFGPEKPLDTHSDMKTTTLNIMIALDLNRCGAKQLKQVKLRENEVSLRLQ